MAFTTKDKVLMELYQAQFDIELQEAQDWIHNGKILSEDEYPMYLDLSKEVLEEFFTCQDAEGGFVTNNILVYEIGKETNAIYDDCDEDSYINRCNYACTLYELYRNRLIKETL